MIPKRYIEEWKINAPWPLEAQTEQDLIIERALVEIFSDELLFNNLSFRGGTALHKFFLNPKLRALYQRKKGRDLFDLDYALKQKDVDAESVVNCFKAYMANSGEIPPTRRQFVLNLEDKLNDKEFVRDTFALLKPGIIFDIDEAYANLKNKILDKL